MLGTAITYLALLGATLLATLLGLIIVFQAYRGYRRNGSQRMLYLAVGFALITVVPFALSLVVTPIAPSLESEELVLTFLLPLSNRLLEILGMSVIIYSLYRK
ncbi:hypothetical protein ACLI4Z_17700 [Natrialbaceae archaeon A-arb3/5]